MPTKYTSDGSDIVGQANNGACAVSTDLWADYEHVERLNHICKIILKSGLIKPVAVRTSTQRE